MKKNTHGLKETKKIKIKNKYNEEKIKNACYSDCEHEENGECLKHDTCLSHEITYNNNVGTCYYQKCKECLEEDNEI